jgi:hypothetical protein
MALLFMDSFDDRLLNLDNRYDFFSTGNGSLNAATGRTVSGAMFQALGGNTSYVQKTLDRYSGWQFGLAVKVVSPTVGINPFLQLLDSANTVHLYLQVNSTTTRFEICRGSDNWVIGQSATSYTVTGYTYVEWQAVIDAATGSVSLTINGVSEFVSGSLNTRNGGNSWANRFRLGVLSTTASTRTLAFDDLYSASTLSPGVTGACGPVSIRALFPNGAGTATAWSASPGAPNWSQAADGSPDGDSSYVYTATPGAQDRYNFTNLPVTGLVKGVQLVWNAVNEDLIDRFVRPVVLTAGSLASGSTYALSGVYHSSTALWEMNPASASGWHSTQIADAEFGLGLAR